MNRTHGDACARLIIVTVSLLIPAGAAGLAEPPLPANFGQASPWLYRGGQPSRDELHTLADLGVRTIVDLREGERPWEAARARELGMEYVALPMNGRRPVPEDVLQRFLALLEAPERRPVYVHCLRGRHRTGVMIALYQVLREQLPVADAWAAMQRHHFGNGHRVLRDSLHARVGALALARPSGAIEGGATATAVP